MARVHMAADHLGRDSRGHYTNFTNQPRNQLVIKVTSEGDLNNPDTPIWPAIGGIFRNGFIKGFSNDTDPSISFENVIQ